jgi:pyridoxamine 5'-phosphate oxidase
MMYDNLENINSISWDYLSKGAETPHNPFHLGNLSTISKLGYPNTRTVVLRRVDYNPYKLYCHTDIRSSKFDEIEDNSKISWHFYEKKLKLQFRLYGYAKIHFNDDLSHKHWEESKLTSRRCYLIEPGPGAVVKNQEHGLPNKLIGRNPNYEESLPGEKNFAVIETIIEEMDFLFLKADGNIRAGFKYNDNSIISNWLIP